MREESHVLAHPSWSDEERELDLDSGMSPGLLPEQSLLYKNPGRLSLVIPAYNEEHRISHTVRAYADFLRGVPHEILVEIDGCNDGTADVIRELQGEFRSVKLLEFSERLGKGRGVLEGMQRASGDWIAYVDADGATSPREFLRIAEVALADGSDAVIGSRYWNRAGMIAQYGFLRWSASRGFNFLVRHMYDLPFRDTQCGTKLFRKEAVRAVADAMKLTDYAFDVELLWRMMQAGFQVTEVPILWNHRDGSTVHLAHVASRMFLDVLRLRVSP